jgi:5-methylcytosine-specific restriction endonuclease McrA
MKSVFQPGLLPLEETFNKRISGIYRAMVQRFGERKFKSGPRQGKVFRPAQAVPFSREEFLAWAEKLLGGKDGAVKCNYCAEILDVRTVGFDHEYPTKQGGSLALINIVPACASCNREKGSLTPLAFSWLREVLKSEIGKHLTIADSREITMRLKSGGMTFSKSAKTRKAKRDAAEAPGWLLED